jgi:hypothetical protein
MKSPPPCGNNSFPSLRAILTSMLIFPCCVILLSFAYDPNRFSANALYFITNTMALIFVFVGVTLNPSGALVSAVVSAVNQIFERKKRLTQKMGINDRP